MKWTSKLGTTINIPDGLSDKQIAKIKADADSGYGKRAQQTANQFRGSAAKSNRKDPNNTSINDNITKSGTFTNPQGVIEQAGQTFNPTNQYWTDLYGKTFQNTYDLNTKNIQRDYERDLEMAKQDAANRGLPFDPGNADSAYSKAVGGVADRYDSMKNTASQQAYAAANAALGTQGALANQGVDTFGNLVLGMSAADLQRYGIDKDTYTKLQAIKKSGSGGASSGTGTGAQYGGSAPGFGV